MQFNILIEVVKATVCVFLTAIQASMMIRAILSRFPIDSNRFTQFLVGITEPIVYPIRKLFQKLNWFQDIPLDMSFMTSFMIITVLIIFLS